MNDYRRTGVPISQATFSTGFKRIDPFVVFDCLLRVYQGVSDLGEALDRRTYLWGHAPGLVPLGPHILVDGCPLCIIRDHESGIGEANHGESIGYS